jgi:heme-degrading monooxygenase HmoA
MPTLQVFPPSPENEALFGEIPTWRVTPIPVVAFDGPEPDGSLGPEAAGAVLVLHMTMVDEERTQAFWRQVALVCKAASETKGFIRMIAFFDGMANWALGFWRTVEDALAFARSAAHTAAIAEMREKNFEYTHFACVYQPVEPRLRHAYCDRCDTEIVMPQETCPACGNEIADVFRIQFYGGTAASAG